MMYKRRAQAPVAMFLERSVEHGTHKKISRILSSNHDKMHVAGSG